MGEMTVQTGGGRHAVPTDLRPTARGAGGLIRPIVMNTHTELQQAVSELRNGTFIKHR
jgi:hypothetical protein